MPDFFETHPLHEAGPVDPALHTYAAPDDLRALLTRAGTSSYSEGLLRFVVPSEFRDYLSLFRVDPKDSLPFLKSAFGHIVFLHGDRYRLLDPIVNSVDDLGDPLDLDFAMSMLLSDRDILESTFLIDVYEQAVPKLGAPGPDEMYTFVPAVGLGGDRDPEHVRRVRMAVEMPILAQI